MQLTPAENEFEGRVALVTGAGAGIGLNIARRLAAGGATLVLTDKHEGRLGAAADIVAEEFPKVRVRHHLLDIEVRTEFDDVFGRVESELGPIRIYIWNAALNRPQPIFEQDPELFDRILYANLNNCWYSCVRVCEQMKRAGGGSIVLLGSMAADTAAADAEPPYAISKAGQRALIGGLARAGGPFNIRCNDVALGLVAGTRFADSRPEMTDAFMEGVPLGRNAATEDVAEAVAYLASDRAAFVTGTVLNVTGGALLRL